MHVYQSSVGLGSGGGRREGNDDVRTDARFLELYSVLLRLKGPSFVTPLCGRTWQPFGSAYFDHTPLSQRSTPSEQHTHTHTHSTIIHVCTYIHKPGTCILCYVYTAVLTSMLMLAVCWLLSFSMIFMALREAPDSAIAPERVWQTCGAGTSTR